MKIIADSALTCGTEEWPLCVASYALSDELRVVLSQALKTPNLSLNRPDGGPRWDWNGEWIERKPSDGPAYGAACYEDVDIFSDGELKGVLRVRRAEVFDPKKEPCQYAKDDRP